jgi:glycosyltransferase involved in cell wall biosynthesis
LCSQHCGRSSPFLRSQTASSFCTPRDLSRFGGSPGQEEGNIPYVEDAGFGAYSGDPAEIAGTVAAWLSSPERLRSMRRSALAAARPRATLDIAGDLAEIAFAAKERGGRSPVGPAGRKAAAVASSA